MFNIYLVYLSTITMSWEFLWMKPQWTFVRSRYLRCNIPNLICPHLPVLYQWQFCKACLFQITFSGLHESSIAAAAAAGWWRVRRRYLQVTSGSTLTRWPLKLAPVWRLTAARPADMFPGEDSAIMSHLNLTINNILEDVDKLSLCPFGP